MTENVEALTHFFQILKRALCHPSIFPMSKGQSRSGNPGFLWRQLQSRGNQAAVRPDSCLEKVWNPMALLTRGRRAQPCTQQAGLIAVFSHW